MGNYDEVLVRLEKFESQIYNELRRILEEDRKINTERPATNSSLIKYKPSKHRKAYRIERYLKKRCYTR